MHGSNFDVILASFKKELYFVPVNLKAWLAMIGMAPSVT